MALAVVESNRLDAVIFGQRQRQAGGRILTARKQHQGGGVGPRRCHGKVHGGKEKGLIVAVQALQPGLASPGKRRQPGKFERARPCLVPIHAIKPTAPAPLGAPA